MTYKIILTNAAHKDAKKINNSNLSDKCASLIKVISSDPFTNSPPYEKLSGDLKGYYSRRINIQHRLVYEVDEGNKLIKILRMWTHYE